MIAVASVAAILAIGVYLALIPSGTGPPSSQSGGETVPQPPTKPLAPTGSRQALAALIVSPPAQTGAPSKESFPVSGARATTPGWPAGTNPSCDIRKAAYANAGHDVQWFDYRRCVIQSGSWDNPYTGEQGAATSASSLTLDSVVPKGVAWSSGARSWDIARQEQFASDPDNALVAPSTAHSQPGARSDSQDASQFMPPGDRACDYAGRYAKVKAKYGLTVSAQERAALESALSGCSPS